MGRNPRAPLSPAELTSLRQLALDARPPIPKRHETLLLSMGLVTVENGKLQLAELGLERLGNLPTAGSKGG